MKKLLTILMTLTSTLYANDKYYVISYWSVETDSGIIGIKPGAQVEYIRNNEFKYGDIILQIPWQNLSKDENCAQSAGCADKAAQEALRIKGERDRKREEEDKKKKIQAAAAEQEIAVKKIEGKKD